MESVIVVFSSITSATGVKKYLLSNYNVQSKLIQTPKNLSLTGCSYCLVVSATSLTTVKKIAKENGVSIKGVFKEDGTRI